MSGEIESVLVQHEAVDACVVVVKEDEGLGKRLVAYYVASTCAPSPHGAAVSAPYPHRAARSADKDGEAPSAIELRSHIALHLPEYMQCAQYVRLDALPLTANGKVLCARVRVRGLRAHRRRAGGPPRATRARPRARRL